MCSRQREKTGVTQRQVSGVQPHVQVHSRPGKVESADGGCRSGTHFWPWGDSLQEAEGADFQICSQARFFNHSFFVLPVMAQNYIL